jgi:hypothetical protein
VREQGQLLGMYIGDVGLGEGGVCVLHASHHEQGVSQGSPGPRNA